MGSAPLAFWTSPRSRIVTIVPGGTIFALNQSPGDGQTYVGVEVCLTIASLPTRSSPAGKARTFGDLSPSRSWVGI